MSNRKSLLFILPLIALVLMACRVDIGNTREVVGSGNMVREEREVSNIERVSLTGFGNLTIIQGNEEGLTVEADDNLLPYIDTEMHGRELEIGIKRGVRIETDSTIRYTLKVKNLDRVEVSGSGNVNAETLKANDFDLYISGSGNVNFEQFEAQDLRAKVSGSGNIDLAGEVDTQEITISGSGEYEAEDLESSETDVRISGAGNVSVWAKSVLTANITGSGDVSYYGKPEITQTVTGSGGLKSLGEK